MDTLAPMKNSTCTQIMLGIHGILAKLLEAMEVS